MKPIMPYNVNVDRPTVIYLEKLKYNKPLLFKS